METTADDKDVSVFHRDILTEEYRRLHPEETPWLVQHSTGRIEYYATEDEACAKQLEYRKARGLDPTTGEPC